MARKHVTQKQLNEAGARSRERSKLRDEARRIAMENAALKGLVPTPEANFDDGLARLYHGRALDEQHVEEAKTTWNGVEESYDVEVDVDAMNPHDAALNHLHAHDREVLASRKKGGRRG